MDTELPWPCSGLSFFIKVARREAKINQNDDGRKVAWIRLVLMLEVSSTEG
jgi:hypothetical protein